ncbi:ComEA family DNA-binding protein [Gemmatimonas sp.]|uniref:ComEA family DNA-binding protein n=1 Tax=Gemmatimonas sp. TaxID=1962908 RepID=UPI003561B338
MPTPAERQALLFVAAVAVIGGGARVVSTASLARDLARAEQGPALNTNLATRALDAQIAAVDSARRAKSTGRGKTSTASAPRSGSSRRRVRSTLDRATVPDPVPPIDVNHASAAELERLPRIGPALAARIVAWREQHGPFESLESLRHVRGIGPATAQLLAPLVTFSGRYSPSRSEALASPRPRASYVS